MNPALASWDTSDSTAARRSSPIFLCRYATGFACGKSVSLWRMKFGSIPGMSAGLQAKRSALAIKTRTISILISRLEARPILAVQSRSAPSVTVAKGSPKVGRLSSNSALGSKLISLCSWPLFVKSDVGTDSTLLHSVVGGTTLQRTWSGSLVLLPWSSRCKE